MQPGIYNLNSANYHADPAPTPSLSSSIANILLNQSPQHAWLAHPRLNPHFSRDVTSRFDLGSAAHMMLLEPDRDAVVIVDAEDWRTKAAKEQRDAAQARGQYAVLKHQYAEVQQMVMAARSFLLTTEFAPALAMGQAERTLLWQEGTVWCRSRPDLLLGDVILDYKTTDSAAPDHFRKQIGRMGYDLQSEFYTRGVKATLGLNDPKFIFLVQEISAPYACSLISLSNAYREVGQLKAQRAIDLWTKALSSGQWPGYETRVLYAEPPPWELQQAEELNTQEEK